MGNIKLSYQTGSIVAENGQIVASMNREAGTTPLNPVERDELAKVFAAAPDLLNALSAFIKAWDNEAAPTMMIRLYNEAQAAIDKSTNI